jgi:hypothetical protein
MVTEVLPLGGFGNRLLSAKAKVCPNVWMGAQAATRHAKDTNRLLVRLNSQLDFRGGR